MKRLFTITLIVIGIVSLFLWELIIYQVFMPDWSRNEYEILRLSPESNIRGAEDDYFFRYGKYRKKLFYSFVTGETKEYLLEMPEGKYMESRGAVVGEWIYYTMSDETVRRFDCGKMADEEVLSREDILRMWNLEQLSESAYVVITRSKSCLLLWLDEYMKEHIYICPVDGDLKTDCLEVNDLFPEEDRTGMEQEILYQGLRIKRQYDVEKERYEITGLLEMESGRSLFTFGQKCTIKAGGKLVALSCKRDVRNCPYWVEGDPEEYGIKCLNRDEYKYSEIQQDKLAVENGEIIGLVHAVKNIRCNPSGIRQEQLRYDVLFRLDPETGESSILYKARNNRTRVIGYQDGVIYLLKNFRIYTQDVENGKREFFLKLPRDNSYTFDWQGDHLIVIRGYEIFGAYKVQ